MHPSLTPSTRKKPLRYAALLSLTLLLGACVTTGGGRPNVPDLPLEDTNGKRHYLSDYVGRKKAVVMTFWATWCMPCRQELSVLQELYDKHRGSGLEILAISLDGPETMSRVRPFIKQNGYSFPVLIDRESRAVALYNPKRQAPMLHIFDKQGRIVYSHGTYQPAQAPLLRRKVRAALSGALSPKASPRDNRGDRRDRDDRDDRDDR
jgi:peroxiredoxin